MATVQLHLQASLTVPATGIRPVIPLTTASFSHAVVSVSFVLTRTHLLAGKTEDAPVLPRPSGRSTPSLLRAPPRATTSISSCDQYVHPGSSTSQSRSCSVDERRPQIYLRLVEVSRELLNVTDWTPYLDVSEFKFLGKGAFGAVYRTFWRGEDRYRPVAVKLAREYNDRHKTRDARDQLRDEISILKLLNPEGPKSQGHPNVMCYLRAEQFGNGRVPRSESSDYHFSHRHLYPDKDISFYRTGRRDRFKLSWTGALKLGYPAYLSGKLQRR